MASSSWPGLCICVLLLASTIPTLVSAGKPKKHSISWMGEDWTAVSTNDNKQVRPRVEGGAVVMSNAAFNQLASAIWMKDPIDVNSGFTLSFSYRIYGTGGGNGNGLAVVFQNSKDARDALGGSGAGLGYAGIDHAVAVEFDTHIDKQVHDPNDRHIAVHSMGAKPVTADDAGNSPNRIAINYVKCPSGSKCIPELAGEARNIQIVYRAASNPKYSTLSVFVDGSTTVSSTLEAFVDIKQRTGAKQGQVYVGFTVGIGDASTAQSLFLESVVITPLQGMMAEWLLWTMFGIMITGGGVFALFTLFRVHQMGSFKTGKYAPLGDKEYDGEEEDGSVSRLAVRQWLRGSMTYQPVKWPQDIGLRRSKAVALIQHTTGAQRIAAGLRLTPKMASIIKEYGVDALHEVLSSAVCEHPFVEACDAVDLASDVGCLIVLRPFRQLGSLRDFMFRSDPLETFVTKYKYAEPMPTPKIAVLGRQVLEAVVGVRALGFPNLGGHLHAGNMLFGKHKGCIAFSDLENVVLGEPPVTRSILDKVMKSFKFESGKLPPGSKRNDWGEMDVDVICFGLLMYELATGISMQSVSDIDDFPDSIGKDVQDALHSIFKVRKAKQLPSIDDLIEMPMFKTARSETSFERHPPPKAVSESAQRLLSKLLEIRSERMQTAVSSKPTKGAFGASLRAESHRKKRNAGATVIPSTEESGDLELV